MALISPEEVDSILSPPQQPSARAISPEEVDNLAESPFGQPDRRIPIPQTLAAHHGADEQRLMEAVRGIPQAVTQNLNDPDALAVGVARYAGRAAGQGGKLLEATAGDIASIPSAVAGYTKPLENVKSFIHDEDAPLPIEERANQPGTVGRFVMKAGLAPFRMEPQLAAGFGLGAMGAPSAMAAAIPMFVTPEGEFDPVGATIAAGLPGVSHLGEKLVGAALAKMPISQVVVHVLSEDPLKLKGKVIQKLGGLEISNDQFRKFLETGGGFVAANAYLLAAQSPQLMNLPPAQRNQAVLDTVAQNIAPSLLSFLRPGMSKSLEQIGREKIAPQMGDMMRQATSEPETPWSNVASERATAESRPGAKYTVTPPITPEEVDHAIDTKQQQTGVQVQRPGANEVGKTENQAGPSNIVPGPAGQPPEEQVAPPAPPVGTGRTDQAVSPAVGAVREPTGEPIQPGPSAGPVAQPAIPPGQTAVTAQPPAQGVVPSPAQAEPVPSQPGPARSPVSAELPKPNDLRPVAPAVFKGIQEGVPSKGIPNQELYNLTEDVRGHSKGSTVSRGTLEGLGYRVPPVTKRTETETKPSGRSLRDRAKAQAAKSKEHWKPIGDNAAGEPVFEDENGVRSILRGEARVYSPGGETKGQINHPPYPAANHSAEFTPVDKTKPEAQPISGAEQPAKSGVGGSGPRGSQPAVAGEAGQGGGPAASTSGPSPAVQPGAGTQVPEPAGGPAGPSGGEPATDVNGVPPVVQPEAPEQTGTAGGVPSVSEVPGQPSEANPAPVPEAGGVSGPADIHLESNPAPVALGQRAKANIDCIELVKKLEKENRFPTDEERQVLAKWSGWGSFKEMFNEGRAAARDYDPNWVKTYAKNYDRLRKLLTPEEFNAAAESSVNAHFTSMDVVRPMWELTRRLGFKGGRVLEPAFGSGVFKGYMPPELGKGTQWTAVELEPITGKIASYLYPNVDVRIQGFEDAKIPNGFYDLAISNVPFHEVGPGKEYPDLNLHNYFLARMLDKVKPGGLVVAITTMNTMEARPLQRKVLAGKAQLVGAIRLPSNAFKESAGTEVVTDILVLRKPDGRPFDGQKWELQVSIEIPSGKGGESKNFPVNEYFVDHPEMVLGQHSLTGTMYKKESYTVVGSGDLGGKLAEALAKFPENVTQQEATPQSLEQEQTQIEDHTLMLDKDGRVMEAIGFKLQLPEWDSSSGTLVRRAKDFIKLRDVLMRQYSLEGDPQATEEDMEANRKYLKKQYDAWLKEHGTLNLNSRKMDMFSSDPGFYPVLGLEKTSEIADPDDPTKTKTLIEPADVLSKRVIMADVPPTKVANAMDALGVSLAYKGRLDPEFMREITGMNDQQIEAELIDNDLAFKDPETGMLATKTDYLSGDVRDKLAKAIFAAKESDAFKRNVEALRACIPETQPFDRISVGISARWTPVPVLNSFAQRVIGLGPNSVTMVPTVEEFMVGDKESWQLSEQARAQWSTEDMGADKLLQHALNFKRAEIRRRTDDGKYVVDEAATALCNQIIGKMAQEFVNYIRTSADTIKYRYFDPDQGGYRTDDLPIWDAMEKEYNKRFNSFVDPKFDGSVLKLPGLSTMVRRTPHLLNGVMRAIMAGSSVFAHGVGSGKTFLLITMAHELQRIGLAKKIVLIVKKPTVAQYRMSIEKAYPGSKCLIPSRKDFDAANRKKLVGRIASNRWDFIVLTHEQFKAVRPGEQLVKDFFNEQIEALRQILREMGEEAAEEAKSTRGMIPAVRNIVKKLKGLKKRLDKHLTKVQKNQDISLNWEQLGVDGLAVDESHNFKKIPIPTQMDNEIKGIPQDFSQRAVDLLVKVRNVQQRTSGRNVFFASGTPVSNTLAELWVQFHATNPNLLKAFSVETFDSFASAFADVVSNFEFGWDNKFHDVTRMARFKNPSGLTMLTRLGMDVRMGNKELGLDVPEMDGGKPNVVIIPPTKAFSSWLELLDRAVSAWENAEPIDRFFNSWVPITVMRAGVSAALDPRCAFLDGIDDPNSKVNTAVRMIREEWARGQQDRTTMMVFADMYRTMRLDKLMGFVGGSGKGKAIEVDEVPDQPASEGEEEATDTGAKDESDYVKHCVGGFNLYNDIRSKLVALGVPEHEIAVVTEHDTDVRRDTLFNKVRSGQVRILIGSTEKIGEGVDVPQRMSAQFHLDPPSQMTPAKMEQRIGRIIRQGNLHSPKNWDKPVRVHLFAQEQSMDAAIYQMLETKGIMILQAIRGQYLGDTFEDPASELTMAMAEMKAAATGDTRVLQFAKLQKEVRELSLQEGAFMRRKSELRRDIDTQTRAQRYCAESAVNFKRLADAITNATADKASLTLLHVKSQKRVTGTEAIATWLKGAQEVMRKSVEQPKTTVQMSLIFGNNVRCLVEMNHRTTNIAGVGLVSEFPVSATYYLGGPEPGFGIPRWDSSLTSVETVASTLARIPRSATDRSQVETEASDKASKLAVAYTDQFNKTTFERGDELKQKRAELMALEMALRGKSETIVPEPTSIAQDPLAALADESTSPAPPLYLRLIGEMQRLQPLLKSADDEAQLAVMRVHATLNLGDLPQNQAAMKEADEAAFNLQERMEDLQRRLAIVEKARLGAARAGSLASLPYGRTPSKRGAQYSIEAPSAQSEAPQQRAVGFDQVRALLSDPSNGLTEDARRVALELLAHPGLQDLDWSKMALEIKDRIDGGGSGVATIARNLIEMSSGARGSTFPHEVFHFLYELLPAEVQQEIEDFRREELAQAVQKAAQLGMPPELFALLRRMVPGDISSSEYQELMAKCAGNPQAMIFAREWYRLSTPSEFVAGIGGDEFSKQSFWHRNDGLFDRLVEKLKSWIRAFMDALRRFFGIRPDMQQIIREMLAGRYRTSPEEGARSERAQMNIEPPDQPSSADNGLSPGDLELSQEAEVALGEEAAKTQVFGRKDTVRGREALTPAAREAGRAFSAGTFAKAGLQVQEAPDGFYELVDPDFEAEIEGRRLLKLLQDEIGTQNESGKETGFLANLLNSVVLHMTQDDIGAFSPQLRAELYAVAQGERSHRGVMLASLQGMGKSIDYVARHVEVCLRRCWSNEFAGDFVLKVLGRVANDFRDYFTESEISDALSKKPEMADFIDRVLALNRRDEGGRVYRRTQALLKPKAKKTLARLEGDTRVTEAVRDILQQAKAQGIEPKPSPNKPLSPLQQLIHLVNPNTAPKIEKLVAQAITQAMRNAGIKAALAEAADDEEREDLQGRFAAGEEPTDDQVEAGLNLPEYSHWRTIRDNMLGYNPVTVKLVDNLLKSDFKGTRFALPPAKIADTRIDLAALAKSPEAEVQRVLDAYSQNLEASMRLGSADPQTRQRIQAMVEESVTKQLDAARQRVREPLFRPPAQKGAILTPEQRIGQLINAGLLGDDRLNVPEMVQRVAARSAIASLTPKAGALVALALQTPFYRQRDLSRNFATNLVERLGISPEDAAKAEELFEKAMADKFAAAKARAAKKAEASITPKERREFKPGKPVWQKIVENVNTGNFDTGDVLRQIAEQHGWQFSQASVDRLKELSERLQRLSTLSPVEQSEAGTTPGAQEKALRAKQAVMHDKTLAVKREMQTIWARLTKPISIRHWWNNRQNFAAAANEFEVANLLLKIGFPVRLATHITTQLCAHTPTRAIGDAIDRYVSDRSAGRDGRLWKDVYTSLKTSYAETLKAIMPALQSARAALSGRAEVRNVDRLMTGVQALERANVKADELFAEGKWAQGAIMRLIASVRLSLRVTQALDNFQGTPAEAQELRALIVTSLRENGRSPAEAEVLADRVLGAADDAMPLAVAEASRMMDASGESYTPASLAESARELLRAQVYENIRALGLPADDFAGRIRLLRSTIAWQERTTTGPGGVVAAAGKAATAVFQHAGLPFSFARFANAMGTGVNYYLMFTPLYGLANARLPGMEPSPWFATERDRMQRRVQAMLGSIFQGILLALAATGALIVRLTWPSSKDEREKLQASGHRLGTVEIPISDTEFIPISLTVGPLSIFSPGLAAGGAIHDLLVKREGEQAKLNAEAAKRGLPAGKIRPVDAADMLGIAGAAAANVVMGGKTATGLTASMYEQGSFNSRKTAAAFLSPMVPGLPAYQEISRMMGVSLDNKLASVLDFMVPIPGSQAQALNMLGDPVGTPDAVQRVIQTITAGTYPGVIDSKAIQSNAAYAALFNSNYRPPTIDPDKGFAINGEFRPMSDEEIASYARLRGELAKQALASIGPGADKVMAKTAFDQAINQALQRMGVDTGATAKAQASTLPAKPTVGPAAGFVPPGSRPSAGVSTGRRGLVSGIRGLRSGLRRPSGAPKSFRGPRLSSSLRPRGVPRSPVRRSGGGVGLSAVRSLRSRPRRPA